jgi:hypothetical protein
MPTFIYPDNSTHILSRQSILLFKEPYLLDQDYRKIVNNNEPLQNTESVRVYDLIKQGIVEFGQKLQGQSYLSSITIAVKENPFPDNLKIPIHQAWMYDFLLRLSASIQKDIGLLSDLTRIIRDAIADRGLLPLCVLDELGNERKEDIKLTSTDTIGVILDENLEKNAIPISLDLHIFLVLENALKDPENIRNIKNNYGDRVK